MVKIKVWTDVEGVVSADEAAKLTGLGVATIWRWIRDEKINVVNMGDPPRTLIPLSEVERIKKEMAEAEPVPQNESTGDKS